MPLVGLIAKKRDVQVIKRDIERRDIEIVEITKESVKNLKNIKFEEIIFLENMILL